MPHVCICLCIVLMPISSSFAADCIKVNEANIAVKLPAATGAHATNNAKDSWSWKYDAVLHNSSQETVYNEVAKPVIDAVLQGFNGTIMCYGQTGAGKTYTQLGGTSSYEYRGVSPRSRVGCRQSYGLCQLS